MACTSAKVASLPMGGPQRMFGVVAFACVIVVG